MNKIICGDALEVLRHFPDEIANTCVTSPPYFGLRNYLCDGQIGVEQTPEDYINKLVAIFREVRRILKSDGCMFVNIGDCYAGNTKNLHKIKKKDLLGVPWQLAFALRDDGWYLRSDIIWHKTNPMPESCKDRPSSVHEHVFLLAKSSKYYYDGEAVRQPVAPSTIGRMKYGVSNHTKYSGGIPGQPIQGICKPRPNRTSENINIPATRNMRNVIVTSTNSYKSAHFAAYPESLITPFILAGCPPGGTVIDPFFGSGTTGAAAVSSGRKYIGIDLNPEYCEIAKRRLAQYTDDLEHILSKHKN